MIIPTIYDYPDRGFGQMPNAEVHHTTLVILAASTAYVMSVADMAQRIIGEAGKAQAA
jgi:biuret amidohydrolase